MQPTIALMPTEIRNVQSLNLDVHWLNVRSTYVCSACWPACSLTLFFSILHQFYRMLVVIALTSLNVFPSLLSALHAELENFNKMKVFICLSTVMTWARSKPLDPVSYLGQ